MFTRVILDFSCFEIQLEWNQSEVKIKDTRAAAKNVGQTKVEENHTLVDVGPSRSTFLPFYFALQ